MTRRGIPALRKRHPDLMDFETWLDREGRAVFGGPQPD